VRTVRTVRSISVLAALAAAALALAVACTKSDGTTTSTPNPIVPVANAATVGPATNAPAANAPAATVRFVGRFEKQPDGAARFAWTGSSVLARFQGSGIAVRLKDEGPGKNVWYAIVDGEPRAMFKTEAGKETYPLATGLSDGVHEVALYKRTEARYGEAVFVGFETPGKLLPAPPPPERRIEVIGDSITTGYGNEGHGPACLPATDQENPYVTYASVSARELKADLHTVAWAGKTIMEMTELWDRTLPSRAESVWDHKSWVPHMVVVNVGTNNFALADPGEARFVRLYTALVERLRKVYPDALIVCALGPMLSDVYPEGHQSLTKARRYMKVAVAKIKEGGDAKVELLEFPEQKHADGMGCGYHPSPKTHKLMAERLVAFAREKLRW
jgi:lysophospholipase L1-like esterase